MSVVNPVARASRLGSDALTRILNRLPREIRERRIARVKVTVEFDEESARGDKKTMAEVAE